MNVINGRDVNIEVGSGAGWIGVGDLDRQMLAEYMAPSRPASIIYDFEYMSVLVEDEWKRLFVNLRREYQKRCLVSLAILRGRGAGVGAKQWTTRRGTFDNSPISAEDD